MLWPAPAYAAEYDPAGSGYTYMGAGNSFQYMYWSKPSHRVRMRIEMEGLSTTRCQDTKLDWNTDGPGQENGPYDARVIRVCQPNGHMVTDGGGDGYSEDPASFEGRGVEGIREAVSYQISDASPLWVQGSPAPVWLFRQDGDPNVYDNNSDGSHLLGHAPATRTSWWARVRTRYQDGSTNASENDAKPGNCLHDPASGRCD